MRGGSEAGDRRLSSTAFFLALTLILIAAGALRFYRLDAQSFWNDEGNSARIAERPVRLIVEGAAGDIHPPGYYLLLAGWRHLFGQSEVALRSLSAVAGLSMVVLTGLLGRHLFRPRVGLAGAALSAVSPFAIYYAQEARMYALLGAVSAASTYAALRAWEALSMEGQGEGMDAVLPLAAYALVNAAGLYTHYAFTFVLLSHNAFFLLRWLVRVARRGGGWRTAGLWTAAQLSAVLLYLPWVPTALRARGWSSAGTAAGLGSAMWDVVRVLTVGVTATAHEGRAAMIAASALCALGLWAGGRGGETERTPSRGWAVTALTAYLAVPLGLFFGFDLYKPAWMKFLIILLPPFHVLAAHGAGRLSRLAVEFGGLSRAVRRSGADAVFVALVGAVGLLGYPSLRNLYFDEAYARDDYRQLTSDIAEQWRPGDGVVLNAPNQWEVFTYYHPDRDVYPAPYRPGPGGAAAFLEPLLEEHERLFVVYWGDAESDPKRRIESWLADHAYKARDAWYGDVRLSTYGVARLPGSPAEELSVRFGESMELQGFALGRTRVTPGEILPVTLFWKAADGMEQSYKVTVQLLDRDGRLMGQKDSVPVDGLRPTTTWVSGEVIVDRYGVWIPDRAEEERARMVVAVYRAVDGQRLPVRRDGDSLGDAVTLGEIVLEASE